jgi:hypothetical protein
MTVQIPDTFLYNGEHYALILLNGERLITPEDYGMKPKAWHTACWQGFYSTYEITNDGLFLKEMTIGKVDGSLKPIQGIMPTPDESSSIDGFSYKGLHIFTKFTGRMLLARDFILDLRMVYPNPIAYQTLFEVTFAEGKLVSTQDLCSENEQQRQNWYKTQQREREGF